MKIQYEMLIYLSLMILVGVVQNGPYIAIMPLMLAAFLVVLYQDYRDDQLLVQRIYVEGQLDRDDLESANLWSGQKHRRWQLAELMSTELVQSLMAKEGCDYLEVLRRLDKGQLTTPLPAEIEDFLLNSPAIWLAGLRPEGKLHLPLAALHQYSQGALTHEH